MNKIESPSPKALCQIWLKLAQWFLRIRWKCEKFDRQKALSSGELQFVEYDWSIEYCLRLTKNCPISFGPHYYRSITTKRQWHDACGLLFAYLIIYMNYICIRRYMTEILLIGSKNTKQSINQSNSVAKNLVRNQLMWPCYFFTHQFKQYKQNQRKIHVRILIWYQDLSSIVMKLNTCRCNPNWF